MTKNLGIVVLIAILALLYIPQLFMQGMFVDGTLYGSVSRNFSVSSNLFILAETHDEYGRFIGHPPLLFWLQGLLFKLFGDHFFVERIFCFCVFIFSLIGLSKLMSFIGIKKNHKWIGLVLFSVMPLSYWGQMQNLIEPLLSLFSLGSVYLLMKDNQKPNWKFLGLATILFVAAIMCKGFVALFVLTAPFFSWIIFKSSFKRALLQYCFLLLGLFILIISLYLYEPANDYFSQYFNEQFIKSLAGKREVNPAGRFHLLVRLTSEVLVIFIPALLVLFIRRKKLNSMSSTNKKWIVFMLCIGFSASLPILVSPKQMGFYLIPSIPYFILAASVMYVHLLRNINLFSKIKSTVNGVIGGGVFAIGISIAVFNFGSYQRDAELLKAIDRYAANHPEMKFCNVTRPQMTNAMIAYFQRRHGVSLVSKGDCKCNCHLGKEKVIPNQP